MNVIFVNEIPEGAAYNLRHGLPAWIQKAQQHDNRGLGTQTEPRQRNAAASPERGDTSMTAEPSVSVVIPTFNRAEFVVMAITSALEQSYRNCDVVVVDDGSTDDTRAAIERRFGDNPRVRYIWQKNQGVSSARNLGLAAAQGDLITFLDSDDLWKPWKLELQVACMRQLAFAGVGMMWSETETIDREGKLKEARANRSFFAAYHLFQVEEMFTGQARLAELPDPVKDPGAATTVYWGDVYSFVALGNFCPTSTVMLTRDRAMKVGGFKESMLAGENHDYHLRACALGPVAFLDIETASCRRGGVDHLSGECNSLVIAENALKTILPAIARRQLDMRIPRQVVRRKIGSLHAWIAYENLKRRRLQVARHHSLESLYLAPSEWRTWKMLFASCVPAALLDRLRESRQESRPS